METGARSTLLRPELVEISPVQRLRQCRCERSTSQRAPACQMPKEGSPRAWVWPLGATCRDPSLREPLASGSGQRQRRRTARAAASLRAEHGALDVRGKSPPWSVSRNAVKPVTRASLSSLLLAEVAALLRQRGLQNPKRLWPHAVKRAQFCLRTAGELSHGANSGTRQCAKGRS